RDDRGLGLEQGLEIHIVLAPRAGPARHPERGDLRLSQRGLTHPAEELGVLRVRSRPPAFDVLDAQLVEPPRDLELIVNRERQALALRAVAQCRVVQYRVHNLASLRGSQKQNGLSR